MKPSLELNALDQENLRKLTRTKETADNLECPLGTTIALFEAWSPRLAVKQKEVPRGPQPTFHRIRVLTLVQHRALRFLETALLILYGSNVCDCERGGSRRSQVHQTLQRLICG